uniref:Putative antirepressor protein n=1 Tax=viral metagenome TaxID=1070528 RepID=A0A6H1ZN76_9ZZZZ
MLVKIEKKQIGEEIRDCVDGRDLHEKLEVKTTFADWIKRRIETAGLVETVDFISFPKTEKAENGYKTYKEYIFTMDSAKHISLMEKTKQGQRIRNYFIEVEKKTKELYSIEKYSHDPLMQQMQQTMMLYKKQLEFEAKQTALEAKQSIIDEKIHILESKQDGIDSNGDFYSIMAYCNLNDIKLDPVSAIRYGKQASRMSRDLGCMVGKVKDSRYGQVNTYHIDVLDDVFTDNTLN